MLYPDVVCRHRGAFLAVAACMTASWGALVTGCSRTADVATPRSPEPATIKVIPDQLTLDAGHGAWLQAQANDGAGQPIGGAVFRFTVSDPRILEVSQNGEVTALGKVSSDAAVLVASGRQEQRVPVTVRPGAPQQLDKVSGDAQQLRAGEAPAAPLTARVLDRFGNPLPAIALTAESPQDFFPSSELVSDARGLIHFQMPALRQAGSFTVELRSSGHKDLSASFSLRVVPGPPTVIERLPAPPSADQHADTPAALTLQVKDAYGNPVPDIALTARTSKNDPAPLTVRTDAAGKTTWLFPHGPRARSITVEVQASDVPTLQHSFTLTVEPPPRPSRRKG
jgi:hypothetical protein